MGNDKTDNYPGARRADVAAFGKYINGTEAERLDYERRYTDNPGDEYQHKQSYSPWSPEEARHHRATAMQCLTRHDHPMSDRSQLTRENCGACVLNGYVPRYELEHHTATDGPNYAGWARIYVEAGRIIPAKWRTAFANQGTAADGMENRAYYDALGRSLVTFGAVFSDEAETNG